MAIAVSAVTPEELARAAEIDLTDARRIVSHVARHGSLPEKAPSTIRRLALARVKERATIPSLELASRHESALDPFVKYAFRLPSGRIIESVRIPLEKPGRFSVCVSSQAGCALACAFCATGKLGLLENLEVWAIVEQVRRVRDDLPEGGRVHGVVFQGMGEPLSNVDRVMSAIRVLSEPSAYAIDRRNITVSTSGLPSGILKLAEELPQVRIGLSLGDVRLGKRRSLMPIDDAHPLEKVLEAVSVHTAASGHAPMFAYTLLRDVNDSEDAAEALASVILAFGERAGIRPRLSLIPFNEAEGLGFERSSDAALEAFRAVLRSRGVGSILRYSGGRDVGAACGQLSTV